MIISVASGKGGVGKTTVVANLGPCIAKLGPSVLLVDADIAMANLSLMFGIHSAPITLHDVLLGDADIYDAIYDGPWGVKIVPSGLSLQAYRRIDPHRLEDVLQGVKKDFEYILVDVPAGIGDNALAAISATEEMILVITPDPASLADALKTKAMAERLGVKPTGVIVNMVRGLRGEASDTEIMRVLELPIFGRIPDSNEIRQALLQRKPKPLVVLKPDSKVSKAFFKVAEKITGIKRVEEKRGGLLSFIKGLFHRRS